MKKTIFFVTVLVVVCMFFTSCGTLFTKGGSDYRSAVSAYERREYVTALRYLSQSLAVNPEFFEASELFLIVFNEGTAYYKNQIATHAHTTDPQSADRVWGAYSRMQDLHAIARTAGQKGIVGEDFSAEVQQARVVAGDLWFAYAQSLREKGDRESIKQAVVAFETAKNRNSAIQDIDDFITEALQAATITLAVVAYGPGVGESFPKKAMEDVTEKFSKDRFVKVLQKYDFSPGEESMVGHLDIAIMEAIGEGWDYVLEVIPIQNFKEINTDTPIRLPSDNPMFEGVKKTIGFQRTTTIAYRLFDIKNNISLIVDDQIREVDESSEYTFSFVRAEGVRELNLGGTGRRNLRYVSSSVGDDATDLAIRTLRWDYETIPLPVEISNPTDQTQWISYFTKKYRDFGTFATNESGKELFYAIEVVHHRPSDTYFIIGPSLEEAITRSKINSAIMNALSITGRNLIKEEAQTRSKGYLNAGALVADAIKHLL